ncbi:MAG: hypothetical protein V1813_03880 [Candidatus Aenigmatarchaeota archaeon]
MDNVRILLAIAVAAALAASVVLFTSHAAAAADAGLDFSPLIGMKPLEGIPMGDMFANERINVYVDGEPVGNIVLSGGTITQAGLETLDDPTMNIRTSAETAVAIATGQKTLGQCFLNGDISYEGVGFINSLKTFFAGIGVWLYSLFN